jgi:signal transduction histidine kinase
MWSQPEAQALRFLEHVSDDFSGIGTGAGDRYHSRGDVGAMVRREKADLPGASESGLSRIRLRLLTPDVALAECELWSRVEMDGEWYQFEPRCSLAFQKERHEGESQWMLAHFHFSVPDAMQQPGGGTLRTALEGRNRALEAEVAERTSELERSLRELKAAQTRLVHQQKMASLGTLIAGVAHEIQNPLNFVNNFAALSKELAEELAEALRSEAAPEEVEAILADLEANAAKIETHGRRADGIVRAMLAHASGTRTEPRETDINALVAECADLAWHGKRAQAPDFEAAFVKDLDASAGLVEVVPEEIGRVVLNLVGNAFDALRESARKDARITVATRAREGVVEVRVSDNGPGIPEALRSRIFEPFYTTKPPGSGVGLGLSLSFDTIVAHGGSLAYEPTPGGGATFAVCLPTP